MGIVSVTLRVKEDAMSMAGFPGGAMARRPLHFIWIVDCSGSMEGQKIQSLNAAIDNVLPQMREAARSNPGVQILMRVVTFSKGALWHVETATPVEKFEWIDVQAAGPTDMGRALMLVAEALKIPPMPEAGIPPALVLVTDGKPTDDFNAGLKALVEQKWGKHSVRAAIAIGDDADRSVLKKFIGNPELEPLDAYNSAALVECVRWVSTVLLKASAAGNKGERGGVPKPPSSEQRPGDSEVWTRRS
jgi:uncharacterized protein YegL